MDREMWIQASVAAGVPAEYGEMLRTLTETMATGKGLPAQRQRREDHGGATDQVR
jgi:hypothetical protein